MRARSGAVGSPVGGGTSRTTASRISLVPIPWRALARMTDSAGGATVPVYSSSRSERVVFPWSTCAITEMARISRVGVDTRGVYRSQKKKPAQPGRPSLPRRLLLLHVRSEVRSFELVVLSLTRGLRIGLGRIAHRFLATNIFAFDGRVLDHRSPPAES